MSFKIHFLQIALYTLCLPLCFFVPQTQADKAEQPYSPPSYTKLSHAELSAQLSELLESYKQPVENWPITLYDTTEKPTELSSIRNLKLAPSVADAQFKEKVELGKKLFFDPRLSKSNQIACASCHDPQLGWADGRRFAFGHSRQQGKRNTMSLNNVAFSERLFWDGRANTLQEQALMPVQDPKEMHSSLEEVVDKINTIDGYLELFSELYHVTETSVGKINQKGEEPQNYQISALDIGDALAHFEMTLISKPTRFDRFIEGDYDQLNAQEIHGLHLFRTKARCMQCHSGPLFSDNQFHHTGLSYYGRKYEDLGLYETTGQAADKGKFKTPSLRELKHTGPYMHNGLFPSLTGVLNMYNAGMTIRKKRKPGEPELSPLIQPLNLTKQEIKDLEAFLLTLSSKYSRYVSPPDLPK